MIENSQKVSDDLFRKYRSSENEKKDSIKVSEMINIDKIDKNLNIISNALKLITIFGIAFGFIVVYTYISHINQLGIFANIISQPYSVIAILVIFGFISFVFFMALSAPYQLSAVANDEGVIIKRKREYLIFLLPGIVPILGFLIWVYIVLFVSKERYDKELVEYIIIISSIFVPAVSFLMFWFYSRGNYLKNLKRKDNSLKIKRFNGVYSIYSFLSLFLYFLIVSLLIFFVFFFVILPITGYWIQYENLQWWFVIFSVIIYGINAFVATTFLNNEKNKVSKKYIYYVFPIIFCFFYWISIIFFIDAFPQRLLYPIGFVELPKDSAWYLIHNNYKSQENSEVNGITKQALESIKKNFSKYTDQSAIDFDNERNKCFKPVIKYQKNALYGYMAWNLGDIKIFCPKSVQFYGEMNKDEQIIESRKCLVLEAEIIQPLSEQYIPY